MMIKYHSKEGSSLLKYITTSCNKMKYTNATFFTYSREAIYQMMLVNNISEDDKILMPSYQCNTVIDYILPFTNNIEFYEIDEELNFNNNEIIDKIDSNTKMIFFVHYFGIISNIDESLIDVIMQKNIKIVHDLAHSFLSLYQREFVLGTHSDYIISSIYKNIPLGVGAIGIGKFQQANSMDLKEFTIVNLKKVATHFRCLIGKRAFSYYDINDTSSTKEETINYQQNIFTYRFYYFLLKHINIEQLIKDRVTLSFEYFNLFQNKESFTNIISEGILENNVLQAYPIKCSNKILREKLFNFLKKDCIDIYPWPSYHPINSFDTLKEKILLLPIDEYSLKRAKDFFMKDNYE